MSESALRPEASTTLDDMNSVDYEIQHFADEKTWVIGPNSKLGVNRIWKTTEDDAIEEQPPTNFGMRKYMQIRDWLSTMNIILPHPQQHLGARLLGHNEHMRTVSQCCGAFLLLWRAKHSEKFNYPDDDWENLARLERLREGACEPAEYLFNELKVSYAKERWQCEDERISRLDKMTVDQIYANSGKAGVLGYDPLIVQMLHWEAQPLESLEWKGPRDETELRIVEAAFLFFIYPKSVSDFELSNKIWEIIISQHSIMYCDPKLPGHQLTFAQGCALRGRHPTISASTEQVGTSVVFDFGKSIGHWKDAMRHLGYCFIP